MDETSARYYTQAWGCSDSERLNPIYPRLSVSGIRLDTAFWEEGIKRPYSTPYGTSHDLEVRLFSKICRKIGGLTGFLIQLAALRMRGYPEFVTRNYSLTLIESLTNEAQIDDEAFSDYVHHLETLVDPRNKRLCIFKKTTPPSTLLGRTRVEAQRPSYDIRIGVCFSLDP